MESQKFSYGYFDYILLKLYSDTNKSEETKGTCIFYNVETDKYEEISNIPFESIQYFTETEKPITKDNVDYGNSFKFKTTVTGLDLDQIVYSTAIAIVGYGASYDKNKYLAGNTIYNYKSGDHIFISSVVVTNLNYIRFMVLKNNSPDDFTKVLDALDEYINEIKSNTKILTEAQVKKLNIL